MGADDPNRQRARRHALRAHLAQADLAALLATRLANVRYLTGFSGSYGALLLLHDRTMFFTDRRYERHAAARVEEAELVLAFDSIVAFGEQAAEPHHRPGDRPLRRGDLIKLDFGARVDGYCSDMTRTVVLGPASERQREVYEVVRRAQAAGLAALRAGVSGAAVDRACREVIGRAGLGDAFSHPSGHGIGLEIREAPRVRVGANGRISPGTPVTVEPGVYLPGFGGVRIEDLAVVRPGGHDVLTTATKELLEL